MARKGKTYTTRANASKEVKPSVSESRLESWIVCI
jgi:hypothetical protein